MSTDYAQQLKDLVESSADPLWWPVLCNWINRFDGWWEHDRDEQRNPAWAIAATALAKNPLSADAHRNSLYLAHLPFNRWHAVTVGTTRKWNPLTASFGEFVEAADAAPIVTFLAPDFEDARLAETASWLWSMWRTEYVRVSGSV
jgi:hypothetical protein